MDTGRYFHLRSSGSYKRTATGGSRSPVCATGEVSEVRLELAGMDAKNTRATRYRYSAPSQCLKILAMTFSLITTPNF